MKNQDWSIPDKPYDLRERLFLFACLIVRVVQFLHTRGPIAIALSYHILKSGNSAGANYEEADDGSSPSDVLAKRKITLRELKETRFRMRVLRHSGLMLPEQDPVIQGERTSAWELGVGSWELAGERSEPPWELSSGRKKPCTSSEVHGFDLPG